MIAGPPKFWKRFNPTQMPTLLAQSQIAVEWTDLDKWVQKRVAKKTSARSTGIHLSGIIKHVLTTSGSLNTEDRTDEMPLRMAIGMSWENWVVGLMGKNFIWQPGEKCCDGIYGSPDGLTTAPIRRVDEFKATWKSEFTHGNILAERIWLWQLMGYCKMLATTRARLHVLWVNGNYRPPSPKYMVYDLQFSKEEIDRFWGNVVLKNKERAVPEVHQ